MIAIGETWSDYDGDSIYGDFTVSSGTVTEQTSYSPGVGKVTSPLGTSVSECYHCDLVGTTRLLTDSSGTQCGSSVLTSFGEHVAGTTHRYGYAGAHGYQTDDGSSDAFPFMHVGHRYYDPSTGRFLQRDPIGIKGGLNVYEYVGSRPTGAVDPTGLRNAELGMWLTVLQMALNLVGTGTGGCLLVWYFFTAATSPAWVPVAAGVLLVSGCIMVYLDWSGFWDVVERIIEKPADFIKTRGKEIIEIEADCTNQRPRPKPSSGWPSC